MVLSLNLEAYQQSEIEIYSIKMKSLISLILIVLLGYLSGCQKTGEDHNRERPIDVTIYSSKVISQNFIGNGVQWDAYPHGDSEQSEWGKLMTDAKWKELYHRLDYMKPRLIRLMIGAKWRYLKGVDKSGKPIIDYQKELEPLEKILDYCQRNNITVLFGEWWPPDFIKKVNDSRWTDMASDYLEFLVKDEGYTCIKYYILGNEPNGFWSATAGNWAQWKSAIQQFHAKLKEKGLADQIQIAGPDAVAAYDNPDSKYTGMEWVEETERQLGDIIGPLETHAYAPFSKVRSGTYSSYYKSLGSLADSSNKPLIMGELGFKPPKNSKLGKENARRIKADPHASEDSEMFVHDYFYGIDMADALIQSMNLGYDGVVAWDLDDAMHTNGDTGDKSALKIWGMWNILGKELTGKASAEAIRPWFYPWSLMCRYFPKGTQIVETTDSDKKGLRMVAGQYKGGYTIAVVNNSDSKYNLQLKTTSTSKVNLKKYTYAKNNRPVNKEGFPVVNKQLMNVNLKEGMTVSIPPKSFQLYTSLKINK